MLLRPVAVVLLVVSSTPALAAGETSFGPQQVITPAAAGAETVIAADVDGDGDLDAVAASSGDDTLAWHENLDGLGGAWAERPVSTTTDGASAVAAVDLDEDGDLDLASAAAVSGEVSWHENQDGSGTSWLAHLVSNTVPGASGVAAADIDGDGDLDLASASFAGDTIAWHENQDGLGTSWLKRTVSAGADGAAAVVAADLDGDGDVDLASASADDDTLAWYESFDGTGTAWIERTISTTADGAAALAVADLNGDGRPDLLAASELDDTIAWYRNTGATGAFRGEGLISAVADGARGVAAADIDGDGDLDALSASPNGDTVAWHENLDGLGGAWAGQDIATDASGARSVAAGDLDGDGRVDALSACFASDTVAWYQNGDDGPPPPPREARAGLDLKPGGCKNSFNAKSKGVLTAVLVASDEVHASDVDLDSLRLLRADEVGGEVAPLTGPPGPKPQLVDLSTDWPDAEPCECAPGGPDGRTDLMLKFASEDVAHELELLGLPKGSSVELELRGTLRDGTPFAVRDCLKLVNS